MGRWLYYHQTRAFEKRNGITELAGGEPTDLGACLSVPWPSQRENILLKMSHVAQHWSESALSSGYPTSREKADPRRVRYRIMNGIVGLGFLVASGHDYFTGAN